MAEEPTPGLSAKARAGIQSSIADSALNIERLLSVGRIVFYSALLLRFGLGEHRTVVGVVAEVPLALGVVFSVYVLARVKHPPRGSLFWFASVTLDTLAAQMALAENAVFPTPGYIGILQLPETAGIILATATAGLRLSRGAALWAGLLNMVGLLTLVGIDRAVSGERFENSTLHLSIHMIFVVAGTMLSLIFAIGTRRIVVRAATAGLRAQQAERGLGTVLADCHDARSLLTSARLSAELVSRAVRHAEPGEANRLKLAGEYLLHDLDAVQQLILSVNSRALADLCVAEKPTPVLLGSVVERVAQQVRIRFPRVKLTLGSIPSELQLLVAGGEVALQRVLLNLLCNACEGDGETPAQEVLIDAEVPPGASHADLRVTDDGPGSAERASGASTKADGLGVGLRIVRGIAESSGGRVAVRNGDARGTVVCVQLPLATALKG